MNSGCSPTWLLLAAAVAHPDSVTGADALRAPVGAAGGLLAALAAAAAWDGSAGLLTAAACAFRLLRGGGRVGCVAVAPSSTNHK